MNHSTKHSTLRAWVLAAGWPALALLAPVRADNPAPAAPATHATRADFEAAFTALLPRLRDPDPARTPEITAAAFTLLLDFPAYRTADVPVRSLVGMLELPATDPAVIARQQYARRELDRYLADDTVPFPAYEKLAMIDYWLGCPPEGHPRPGMPEPDLDHLQRAIVHLQQRAPLSPSLADMEDGYLEALKLKQPEAVETHLREMAGSPNPALVAMAKGRLLQFEDKSRPLDMAFTALDGREVDLAKLRGKVVLVDFWAMWCSMCVAELPNIKAAYEKYHDRGLEVIGIDADGPRDGRTLTAFLAQRGIAWPQYFNATAGKNRFVAQYAVTSFPTTFLLDQDGRIAATDLVGPKLEAEVRRLLKL